MLVHNYEIIKEEVQNLLESIERGEEDLDLSMINDPVDERNNTLLHYACDDGHLEVVKLLLKYGANTEEQNLCEKTALYFAATKNKLETVKLLLNHGAKVDLVDRLGRRFLHELLNTKVEGNVEILRLFLEHGAEVDQANVEDGVTALHFAAFWGHLKSVEVLLKYNANMNVATTNNVTPLLASFIDIGNDENHIQSNNLKIAKLFLSRNAQFNFLTPDNSRHLSVEDINNINKKVVNGVAVYAIVEGRQDMIDKVKNYLNGKPENFIKDFQEGIKKKITEIIKTNSIPSCIVKAAMVKQNSGLLSFAYQALLDQKHRSTLGSTMTNHDFISKITQYAPRAVDSIENKIEEVLDQYIADELLPKAKTTIASVTNVSNVTEQRRSV